MNIALGITCARQWSVGIAAVAQYALCVFLGSWGAIVALTLEIIERLKFPTMDPKDLLALRNSWVTGGGEPVPFCWNFYD